MKIINDPDVVQWPQLSCRPSLDTSALEHIVEGVYNKVKLDGDSALLEYTNEFDGVELGSLILDENALTKIAALADAPLKAAIDTAYNSIRKYHEAQMPHGQPQSVETFPGVTCWRELRPIDRIGIYVPGGSAPLFSTLLMCGVPAQIAGRKEVVVCTPPNAGGSVHPALAYAAKLVGANSVACVGGAQAVAAMVIGTESILKVDKIFGPGNQYVTAAKQKAQNYGVAIDMPAGPSEVLVIADESARVEFVAADLLSQAEHGEDSQVVLLATSELIAEQVRSEVEHQLKRLPRKQIAKVALQNSFALVFKDVARAIEFSNAYAPEHLILNVTNPEQYVASVVNAGSVFLGAYAPEAAGDYASGPNHTLPTGGWARSYSGLTVETFCKYISFQIITSEGAQSLGPTVMQMAAAEGLEAHRYAMELRQ